MIAALIAGMPFEDVAASDFWRWGDLHPEVAAIAAGSWRTKTPPRIKGTGYCVDALEAAIWAVAEADDFRGAVLRAANLGDDADTTAAIAGQLAGARWGATAIPATWREKVVGADRIVSLARGLYAAGGGAVDDRWAYDPFLHAWWVKRGRLLAGEYPGHPDPVRARHKVDVLIDAGVRTFVDLTTPADRLDPYEPVVKAARIARNLDLRRLSFPIPDLGVVDDHDYDTVAAMIEEALERGGVYVHCWGGIGRTGTVVGCVLVDEGLDYDGVIARLTSLREGTRKARRAAPEMPVQHDVLRRRADRRRRTELGG